MAVYEFKCNKCMKLTMKNFDINSKVKKVECKFCGDEAERIISNSNFALKGKNWAKDNYGLKKEKK